MIYWPLPEQAKAVKAPNAPRFSVTQSGVEVGVLPLAIATGAGAGGRIAIGTGVVGGMLTATVLAVLLVPVFFVSVRSVFLGRRQSEEPPPSAHEAVESP